jgi:hypothetical protein
MSVLLTTCTVSSISFLRLFAESVFEQVEPSKLPDTYSGAYYADFKKRSTHSQNTNTTGSHPLPFQRRDNRDSDNNSYSAALCSRAAFGSKNMQQHFF